MERQHLKALFSPQNIYEWRNTFSTWLWGISVRSLTIFSDIRCHRESTVFSIYIDIEWSTILQRGRVGTDWRRGVGGNRREVGRLENWLKLNFADRMLIEHPVESESSSDLPFFLVEAAMMAYFTWYVLHQLFSLDFYIMCKVPLSLVKTTTFPLS